MSKREALQDTLATTVRASDVMKKFGVSKGTALKIMRYEGLHSYKVGNSFVCERQYWDKFINALVDTGGTVSFSCLTSFSGFSSTNKAREYLKSILTEEEYKELIHAIN